MTRPVVFIDAIPPDAPESTHESQRSKIRRAAAYHTHNTRRQKSIAYEENKQNAVRQVNGGFQQIRPRLGGGKTRLQLASHLKQPCYKIDSVSTLESQEPTYSSKIASTELCDSGSQTRTVQIDALGNQALMQEQSIVGEPDDGILSTSDRPEQTEASLSVTRPGPSLFFSRWNADRQEHRSKLGLNTIASTLEAIDCFVGAVLPNNAPLYDIFEISNHLVLPVMDELITDHSFREIWSSSMHNCRSVLAPSSKSPQSTLMHKVAGMAMLRDDMEDSAFEFNDYKLAAIACLAYMSSWDGNLAVADIHFNYLSRAIQNRGGLDVLGFDGWLRSTILQLDSLLALQTGVSKFQAYRVCRFPSYLVNLSDPTTPMQFDALPVGFRRLAHQRVLSLETIEVLARINHFGSQVDPSVFNSDVTARWRSGRHQDFYDALPCLRTPGVSLEKLLCAALILYSVNQFSPQSSGRDIITAFVVPRRYVAEHLPEIHPISRAEEECLVWIYAVLIDSYATLELGLLIQYESQFPGWRHGLLEIIIKFLWSPKFAVFCQNMSEVSTDSPEHDVEIKSL